MKNKLLKLICIAAFLLTYLASCKGMAHAQSIGPCMDPSFGLAFPTYATAQPNPLVRKVLPSGDWQIETAIPNGNVSLIASFVIRGKNELWLRMSQDDNAVVYRYRIDTHEWTKFISTSNEPVVPQGLVVSQDGTLWGVGWVNHKLGPTPSNSYPILSRFDDVSERFGFVEGTNSEELQSFSAPRYPPMIKVDNSGVLWLILNRGMNSSAGLYSFDPANKKLTHHLPDLSLSGKGSIAVAPNNEIWLFDPALKAKLIRYFPQTGKYDDSFINRSDWNIDNAGGSLYFDRSGRLWLGDNGWIDLTNPKVPVWYQIIRSPVFITDYYDGENQYVWLHPSSIFQSSNGWYWFSSPNLGIVRLDTNTEEWCRFTTEYSPVIEDSRQNIWIIVTDKLFVYSSKVDTVLKAKR